MPSSESLSYYSTVPFDASDLLTAITSTDLVSSQSFFLYWRVATDEILFHQTL